MVEIKASVGYVQPDGNMTVDTLVKNTEISSLVIAFDFYSTDVPARYLASVSSCIPPFGTSGCVNVRVTGIPFKDPYRVQARRCISGPNCGTNSCTTFSSVVDSAFTGEVVRYDGVVPSQATYTMPSDCVPCQPSWSCESPLNGYEYERCTGQRRLNPVCNPVPSKASIYNIYTTPDVPKAGDSIKITTEIANIGSSGKIRAVFKVSGTQISDQNSTLGPYPGGGLWSPTITYTMPNTTITISVDAYGFDGTNWVLTDTKSITRTPAVVSCTGTKLTPFASSIKSNEKVTFTVSVDPSTTAFDVQFKDRAGTVLGTCKTEVGTGSCTFIWDSSIWGKTPGTYYVRAYVAQGGCISTESVIDVAAPIRQWNFNVTVKDSKTGLVVSGATVVASTVGGAPQSKVTDTSGFVSFRMDEGTVNVAISANKYNTYNTAEYLFSDKSVTYPIDPIPPTPTTGSIEFVSVPVGASIWIDGSNTGVVTQPTFVAIVSDLKAGDHTWALKLTGFNDSSGKVTVPSGGTASVYATLTPSTPTMGSLNITSTPMGAAVFIDGKDYKVTTSGATTITNIPPGIHSLILTMTGYQDYTTPFNITAGQTTYLNPTLIPLTTIGTLEISSDPSGARIYIDEKDTERNTPGTISNLIAGDHKYKLVLSGYKEITGIVSIEAGKTKTVHIILEKSIGIQIGTGVVIAAGAAIAIAILVAKKE